MMKSHDPVKWEITSETKKSPEDLLLQKAKTRFGGRVWVAWFAQNIPVTEGPYKFQGLPGLIYELYDTEKKFHYILMKNRVLPETFSTQDFIETFYGKTPILVTQRQYEKIMLDDYNDPVAHLTKILKDGGTITINGEKITSIPQLDKRREAMQESILKNYVPIEKDKAIPYPAAPKK